MNVLQSCLCLLLLLATAATAFLSLSPALRCHDKTDSNNGLRRLSQPLLAKKTKKKKSRSGGGGGGFGGARTTTATSSETAVPTIKADKTSLEKQWDVFASITDLEIRPKGDPSDDDYVFFEVVDVFVRCGKTSNSEGTRWFRIGKVCATDDTKIDQALTLQKGLIFWTAVHMRRELLALGKSAAAALELGFIAPANIMMGSESDGPLDDDEAEYVEIANKVSVQGVQSKSFGFRPDWNPPGFTYKRREKDAMKKKKSSLEEIVESG